jgi:putative methylase
MGAKHVFAVDIDSSALKTLKSNASKLNLIENITLIQRDITQIQEHEIKKLNHEIRSYSSENQIICIMNPPFGIQKRHADRPFLHLAMKLADKIYTIHLSNPKTRVYIENLVNSQGWVITSIHSQKLVLEHAFSFHKQKRKSILSDVYKMEKKTK